MNKEFLHMQKLAGIITESEYKAKINENADFNKWDWENNHGMDIVFKFSPANPNEILTQHDEEYLDPDNPESENFTKAYFWKNDISKESQIDQGYYDEGGVVLAKKLPNGTWKLIWDSGIISGFKEGEDFEFVPKNEL